MITHQHAPSPERSEDLSPIINTCPDCGDLELDFWPTLYTRFPSIVGKLRCSHCHQEKLRAQRRERAANALAEVTQATLNRTLDSIRPLRSGEKLGCNDELTINCEECGEASFAVAGDTCAEYLDGMPHVCENCDTPGLIVHDTDEETGAQRLFFRRHTKAEIAKLGLMVTPHRTNLPGDDE